MAVKIAIENISGNDLKISNSSFKLYVLLESLNFIISLLTPFFIFYYFFDCTLEYK